jgi:hypothetical protein
MLMLKRYEIELNLVKYPFLKKNWILDYVVPSKRITINKLHI